MSHNPLNEQCPVTKHRKETGCPYACDGDCTCGGCGKHPKKPTNPTGDMLYDVINGLV